MAKILAVKGRKVWDSRGRATVEAEVVVGRGATPLALGRAIAPAGASTGKGEARALDAEQAVQNINRRIHDALKALSVSDQAAIDRRLVELDGTPDRSRLGANAIVAVSLACAHADAAAQKVPLWKKLAGSARVAMPVPQVQIFGGGAHASGRVDIQDYMVICIGAGSFRESLDWTAQIYAAAGRRLAKRGLLQGVADEGGYWPAFKSNEEALEELVGAISDAGLEPGRDAAIALDIAASQLYRGGAYHLGLEKRQVSAGQLHAMLGRWIERYPLLPHNVRDRLVIENDDTIFNVADALFVSRNTGVPIVFDNLHHRINGSPSERGDETMGEREAMELALATWPHAETPKIHYSDQRTEPTQVRVKGKGTRTQAASPGSHADYIDPPAFAAFIEEMRGLDFDVMFEAKAKEWAAVRVMEYLREQGRWPAAA